LQQVPAVSAFRCSAAKTQLPVGVVTILVDAAINGAHDTFEMIHGA